MDPTLWLTAAEDRAWRAWLAMAERLRSQIGRDLQADSGLSDADYMVLVHLSEAADQRMRMSDLATCLNWSKSRLSHQLARMQARGLVQRDECPSDARGAFAVLAPGGLAEIERAAPQHVASVRRHFIDVLDDAQLEQLAVIGERVVAHLRGQSVCQEAIESGRRDRLDGQPDTLEGSCGPNGGCGRPVDTTAVAEVSDPPLASPR
jgi:DNA-binding MarR family transcriptional regulator